MIVARYSGSPSIAEALMNAKANLEATTKVRHLERLLVSPICTHWSHVCSLKAGRTPLMYAAWSSKCPDVVEALMNGKANLEATDTVRCLEDNRCAPYMCSLATRVFVEERLVSSNDRCAIF